MVETIYWRDGSRSVLFPPEGDDPDLQSAFLAVLREREPDAARFLEEHGKSDEYAAVLADAAEKEQIADGLHAMCQDALECLERVYNELLAVPRPTRAIQQITALAKEGYQDLYKNL